MPLAEIPLSAWRKRSQTFVFRGQPIRYWTTGQGEPLLLIHGFPTASWDWHYLWQPLAQRYRVIACDMLGFGDSAKPINHTYSLLEQADLQQALLAHLQVEQPVHVLAHDYGDSVAQELLARHCEDRFEIASCVFLNGGLFPETHHPVLVQKLLLQRLLLLQPTLRLLLLMPALALAVLWAMRGSWRQTPTAQIGRRGGAGLPPTQWLALVERRVRPAQPPPYGLIVRHYVRSHSHTRSHSPYAPCSPRTS